MTFMAGTEAELILVGSTKGGDGDDRYQIELMANQLDYDTDKWTKREARLRRITRLLIRRHQNRIERVAEALLVKGELSAKQLDDLTGRSVDDVNVNAPMARLMSREGLV
jgi:hypothetical protein